MIEFIKGRLVVKYPTHAIIETNGLGYFINISLTTYSDISDAEKKKIRSAWTLLSLCTGNCYGTILKIVQRKTELSHYNTINSLIHMVISQLPQSTINTIAKQYFKPAK